MKIIDLIELFQSGGIVLFFIFFICLFLWFFLLERFLFIRFFYQTKERKIFDELKDKSVEEKFKVHLKKCFISQAKLDLKKNLNAIQTLIIVSPLVGLLGTVTGMIKIFDTLSYSGSSDIKLMASGISMATIPTMAGMVVALSGILFKKRIDILIKDKIHFISINSTRILHEEIF